MIKAQSPYLNRFIHPYRSAWELHVVGLSIGVFLLVWLAYVFDITQTKAVYPILIAVGVLALLRLCEGSVILFARLKLAGRKMTSEPLTRIKQKFCNEEVFLGYGFRWEPHHTQRLHDLSKDKSREWKLPRFWHKLTRTENKILPATAIGKGYLHGVSFREESLYRPVGNFEGGLLIVGTTQSGKGLTMQLLINQAVNRGDVVIYIDPKGSDRMERSISHACRAAGRSPMLLFHPNNTDMNVGIRMDPFSCFDTADEVASRIAEVIGNRINDPFTSFAVEAVKAFSAAMIYLEEKPTLSALMKAQSQGIEPFLLRMLKKAFREFGRQEELEMARAALTGKPEVGNTNATGQNDTSDKTNAQAKSSGKAINLPEIDLYVKWYEQFSRFKDRNREVEFSIVIKVWRSPQEHWQKVTASLAPVLSSLTGGAMDKLLSPKATDAEDLRAVWSIERIIDSNSVLYMRLDSMSSSVASDRLGSLILADLVSVIGKRYNLKKKGRRISLFVDEASNVINNALIQIMNKGAEAGVNTTIAMQTLSDLSTKLGSADAARMVLGNCNNIMALRCMDGLTRQYVAESFGRTYIRTASRSLGSSSEMEDGGPSYDARASHSLSEKQAHLLDPEHLAYLPNGEYFGLFGGGHLYKGRIPVVTVEESDNV